VVDLEGGIDRYADHFVWYKYWPIADGDLPDLTKLWEMAQKEEKTRWNQLRKYYHQFLFGVGSPLRSQSFFL